MIECNLMSLYCNIAISILVLIVEFLWSQFLAQLLAQQCLCNRSSLNVTLFRSKARPLLHASAPSSPDIFVGGGGTKTFKVGIKVRLTLDEVGSNSRSGSIYRSGSDSRSRSNSGSRSGSRPGSRSGSNPRSSSRSGSDFRSSSCSDLVLIPDSVPDPNLVPDLAPDPAPIPDLFPDPVPDPDLDLVLV